MKILNDFNVSQLEFKNLPANKEVTLIMHGNVYQFQSDFYVNGIFLSEKTKYYLSLLPLKSLAAFPLGSIFKNRRIIGMNVLEGTKEIQIHIGMKYTGFNKIKDIAELRKEFMRIPNEIMGYSGQQKAILNQVVAIYKDQISGQTIYIPYYEIARWYYLRSSSLTRQVLSANLDGLFYKADYLDPLHKNAELILKYGTSNGDVAEIFRFAKDEFANIMFKNFSLDLSANKFENTEDKYYNVTKLRANFPVYDNLNLKVKGFKVGKGFFVYQFITEDSNYPFETLNVYRYRSKIQQDKIAIVQKKSPKQSELGRELNYSVPSSEFISQTVQNNVYIEELRKGLENKTLNFKPMLEVETEGQSLLEEQIAVSGIDIEMSLTDASKNGDEQIIHSSFSNIKLSETDELIERENNLIVLINLLFDLVKEDKRHHEPLGVSVSILIHSNLPRKPEGDPSRAQWKKAYLTNGEARQYLIAKVTLGLQDFYLIEIERENDEEKISLMIVYKKYDNVSKSILHKIIRDYVQSNGKWKIPLSLQLMNKYHTASEKGKMLARLYIKLRSGI